MNITELVIQDISTFDSLIEAPIETFSFDFIYQDEAPSDVDLFEALLPSTTSEELTTLAIEDAITGLEATYLHRSTNFFDTAPPASLSQPDLGSLTAETTISFGDLYDDPIEYGTPLTDAQYWRQQQGSASCAVVAQISVYQSLTGQYISEYDASVYAQQQGWFDPVLGTPLGYTGHILDGLGIPTYEISNASFYTLEQALSYGDKPIVGLDGSEIWNPMRNWDGSSIEQANEGHAVWVTGIDYEWNGSLGVIVNDSGHLNGMASVIDYYDFMNAWQDYGYFVSIADSAFV
ncbi:MAG: hypothetical protein WBA76_04970 [Phormidesmis sp.]